ncbi:hypothetical protein FF1_009042 [Malus domestica]
MAFRVRTRACCPWFFSLSSPSPQPRFSSQNASKMDGINVVSISINLGRRGGQPLIKSSFSKKSFDVENKLKPERKVLLAKDIGLHLCILCV